MNVVLLLWTLIIVRTINGKKRGWVCVSIRYRDQTQDPENRYIINYGDKASLANTLEVLIIPSDEGLQAKAPGPLESCSTGPITRNTTGSTAWRSEPLLRPVVAIKTGRNA
jgi:hypothetical protein